MPLDAYANCFVQRHRPGRAISAPTAVSAPAPPPPPPRAGLALRDLAEPEAKPAAKAPLQDALNEPPPSNHDD